MNSQVYIRIDMIKLITFPQSLAPITVRNKVCSNQNKYKEFH